MSNTASNTQTPQRFSGEWETRPVSEFGNVVTGATPSTKVNAFWNGPYPWITPTDITFERDMTVSERLITQEGLNAIRTLPPNTVLVTCIASIGKNAILRTTGGCNQQINAVIPNSAHNAEFLYYLFEFNSDFLLANAGITATNIVSKSTFSNLVFGVPPLSEQHAIAEVLSDVDGLLNALDTLIAKKQAIKQATMQQLLTGKTRLPGFSGAWETKRLGEITKIQKGSLITEKSVIPGPIPVIAGGQKPAYYHNTANRTGKTITVSGSGAYAGFVAFHNQPIFASDCSTISENSNFSIDFIYYFLVFNQDVIYKTQTGGAQPHVHPVDLMPLEVNLPELSEQQAIASVLSDMDAEIAALEQRRDKTRAIKQGMMQELLTGRVRLSESRICTEDTEEAD